MAASLAWKRYSLLLELLTRKTDTSLEEILEYIENHDILISKRTLQRDIESLRYNFGIDIIYNTFSKGYNINTDQRFPIDDFLRIAQLKIRSELLNDAIIDLKNNRQYLSFDASEGLKGLQYLEPLLGAIRDRRKVSFSYTRFDTIKAKKHTVKPYHLKEYLGRWYLLGMTFKGLTTFALDRLDNLDITTKVFARDKKIDPKKQFDDQIGISWGDEEPEIIKLYFTKSQLNYIKTLPWHSSQQIVEEDENGATVSYFLSINYEFVHQIVAHGINVKVLEPKNLAKEIAQIHKKAFSQY